MLDGVRKIFAYIDVAVYKLVEVVMQLIMDLANVEMFTDSVINEFANRIYIILGLVMLFKMMISFIQILINPDKMDDKEQGVGNILKRVIISLALIFLVPSIFDLGRQVQSQVIPVIPKVLLGVTIDPNDQDGTSETMNSVGRMMSFYSFMPFFTYDNASCNDGSILGTGNDENAIIWNVTTAKDAVNTKDSCSTDENNYKYSYSFFISTVVGAFLVYVLVTVAVKIAIRAIKLGICEFVAPIPIASYIDPKTSKQAFDSWVKISINTYLDLFIRLIIVYFVVFIFLTVLDAENIQLIYAKLGGDIFRGSLVTLFIIVGLLMFVKEAPKFISDLLGLKGGGDFMDMFKGTGWKALGGTVGAPVGVLGSGLSTAMKSYARSSEANEKMGLRLSRAAGALFGSSGQVIANRLRGKSHRESVDAARGRTLSRVEQAIQRTAGYTAPGARAGMRQARQARSGHMREQVRSSFGFSSSIAAYDNAVETFKDVNKSLDEARNQASKTKVGKYFSREEAAIQNSDVAGLRTRLRGEMATLENKVRSGAPLSAIEQDKLDKLRDTFGTQYSPGRWSYNFNDDGLVESQRSRLANEASQKFSDYQKEFVNAVADTSKRGAFDAKYGADMSRFGFTGIDDVIRNGGPEGALVQNILDDINSKLKIANNANGVVKEFFDNATDTHGNTYRDANGNFNVGIKDIYDTFDKAISDIPRTPEYQKLRADSVGVKPPKDGGK